MCWGGFGAPVGLFRGAGGCYASPKGQEMASAGYASLYGHPKGLIERAAKRRASTITRRG